MKSKLYRAKDYGRQIAIAVMEDFLNHPEDHGPKFSLERLIKWIPNYTSIQVQINFGPYFPVKDIYINAAINAANKEIEIILRRKKLWVSSQ